MKIPETYKKKYSEYYPLYKKYCTRMASSEEEYGKLLDDFETFSNYVSTCQTNPQFLDIQRSGR